jgi:hypothetical protein
MNTFQKASLYIFGVVCLVGGLPLLLAPGSFLGLFGWAPVDPLLSRILGAGALGMAWGAWRISRALEVRLSFVYEMFFFFTALGSVGLLRHLLIAHYPFMVWFLCAVLLLLSAMWAVNWWRVRKSG